MAVTNGYCTEAEVRAHLGDSGSTLDSALLDKAINAASRAIDRYCGGRRFWKGADVTTRTYRVDDSCVAYVDDIATVVGLIIKTDTALDGTWAQTWASTDYQLEPLNGGIVAAGDTETPYSFYRIVAVGDYLFPVDGRRVTLQVTAKFGWSAVPDDVNQACIIKATSLFRRKDAPFGVAGFGDFGPVRITRQDPDVMDLLSGFRWEGIA